MALLTVSTAVAATASAAIGTRSTTGAATSAAITHPTAARTLALALILPLPGEGVRADVSE